MAIDLESRKTLEAMLLNLVQDMDRDIKEAAEKLGKPPGPGENSCLQEYISDFLRSKKGHGKLIPETTSTARLGMAIYLHLHVARYFIQPEAERKEKLMTLYRAMSIANQLIGTVWAGYGSDLFESRLRSEWAKLRHAETYALRQEVIDYWKQKINPKLSNEKAATELECIFPLSHRKLSQYVSMAKKELRSAGKA